MNSKKRVIFIVGPTGVGKTWLSIQLAKHFDSEVVNCDSVQVYKDLIIGSARPLDSDMESVPHHLFGFIESGREYTAADFRKDALKVLSDNYQKRKNNFIVVGGSGFYLQALISGMFDIPEISIEVKNRVFEIFDKEGSQGLFRSLEKNDPLSAERLNESDIYRVRRALEVYYQLGRPISEIKEDFKPDKFPYDYKIIGISLEKKILKEKIIKRTQLMIQSGIVEETKTLIEKGFRNWRALNSVGYKQCMEFLDGKIQEENLIDEIVIANMKLIKKQMTWFKRDASTNWWTANDLELTLNGVKQNLT